MQLDLPIVLGEPIRLLPVQMDGIGVAVVKKETLGRQGKLDGQPAHAGSQIGCGFTQAPYNKEGYPISDPDAPRTQGLGNKVKPTGKMPPSPT